MFDRQDDESKNKNKIVIFWPSRYQEQLPSKDCPTNGTSDCWIILKESFKRVVISRDGIYSLIFLEDVLPS